VPRMIGEADERPHEQGSEETWSESYYFAWFSPERSGITRIANRPNEGTQDVLVVVYDADGSITLARHKREEEENTDTLDVGGVQYRCEEPMKRWRITASADGLRLPSPRVLLGEEGGSPEPARLELDLVFEAEQPPAETAQNGPEELLELVRKIAAGHFEQSGTMTGTIGGERFEGRGYRDKSWGMRDWSAPELWRWYAMPFGPDLAMNAVLVRIGGHDLVGGWAWRGGDVQPITGVEIDTGYGDDGRSQETVALELTIADGERVSVRGEVVNIAHLPIAADGRTTLLNEGLARWRLEDGRETLGIAEYLHQLGDEPIPGPGAALLS
jgi:hypothetical protein